MIRVENIQAKDGFQVSPSAIQFLSRFKQGDSGNEVFMVTYSKAGCSGVKFSINCINKSDVPAHATLIHSVEGVEFYADNAHKELMSKIHVDLITDKINTKLVFNSPQIEASCGCGESYFIKDLGDHYV